MTVPVTPLANRVILVVEDDFILGDSLVEALADLGARVLGPCSSLSEARGLSAECPPELALLDVNVRGEPSLGLASELRRRGVSIGFITGYSRVVNLPAELESIPRLLKPFDVGGLERFVRGLLNAEDQLNSSDARG